MAVDPKRVCLFIPGNLKKFKLKLFEGIGEKIEAYGGLVIRADFDAVGRLPDDVIPIIGCSPQFRPMIVEWRARKRSWIYWDRGYLRRVFATWLPRGHDGGYYRWHVNSFQMTAVCDVPPDRFKQLVGGNPLDRRRIQVEPWRRDGRHILVADTGFDYWDLHADRQWINRTVAELKRITKRPIIVRGKESKVPLNEELKDAHALVTHGSIAAVESVIMGCPVFVEPVSAAALVGQTDLRKIETPVYPERQAWLNSLAYSQFSERELVDGTLWRLIT